MGEKAALADPRWRVGCPWTPTPPPQKNLVINFFLKKICILVIILIDGHSYFTYVNPPLEKGKRDQSEKGARKF